MKQDIYQGIFGLTRKKLFFSKSNSYLNILFYNLKLYTHVFSYIFSKVCYILKMFILMSNESL